MRRRTVRILLAVLGSLFALLLLYAGGMGIAYASIRDTGLPKLSIQTDGGAAITSKTEYLACSVALEGADAEFCFAPLPAEVRGRGNDTWKYYPKKPYRLKFSEKVSLFGENENRNWVLLALYNDQSLSKDRLAFALADVLGSGYVPSCHYVDLYVNGSYRGVYLLTEQVNESKGRLDLKENFDETDVAIPFLVELDARAPEEGVEGVDWFEVNGKSYTVKYPEANERFSEAQFAYVRDTIAAADALCRKENVTLEEISEIFDTEALMDYYLVEELMGQPEINWKSVYMSQTPGETLRMGPVWDFDWAATGPDFGESRNRWSDPEDGFRSTDNFFALLYRNSPAFRTALRERWNAKKDDLRAVIDEVAATEEVLTRAAAKNHLRWYWWSPIPAYSDRLETLTDWCLARWEWMDRELNS